MSIKKIIKAPLLFIYRFGLKTFGGLGLQKIWPFGVIRDWLSDVVRKYDKPRSVVFRGQTIFLDPNDNLELSVWGERHAASREIGLMESILKLGDTAVDVGANIGLMTLFMAKATGSTGRVFAFEPEPENFNLLQKNIAANAYKNVTVVPVAVLDHPGTLKLFLSDFNPGDHRIYDPKERTKDWGKNGAVYDKLIEKRTAIDVPVIALDEYFSNYKKPVAVIIMDVQGAEGGVLKGITGILKKYPHVKILTEFWPAGQKMFGVDAGEFLTMLEDFGFSFYEVEDYSTKNSASKNFLLQKYTVLNNKSGNLLVTRESIR